MIITIDGPVATGKSTVAKKLAQALGYIYFDTGAMYRALTYGIIKHRVDVNDHLQLESFLSNFNFEIKVKQGNKFYYVDDEDVTSIIRDQEVSDRVSEISAIPLIREKLVAYQRELASGVNAVFEGRDMGTVVFPNAHLKIFLTGRQDVRILRRYEELVKKFPESAASFTLEKVKQNLEARDHYDSTRETSPLCQAEDAYAIDTSDLTVDEVVAKILEYRDSMKTKRKDSQH